MPEVPPPMRVASSTVTAAPACASRYATEAPITPAPITIVLIISAVPWACDEPDHDHCNGRWPYSERRSLPIPPPRAGEGGMGGEGGEPGWVSDLRRRLLRPARP